MESTRGMTLVSPAPHAAYGNTQALRHSPKSVHSFGSYSSPRSYMSLSSYMSGNSAASVSTGPLSPLPVHTLSVRSSPTGYGQRGILDAQMMQRLHYATIRATSTTSAGSGPLRLLTRDCTRVRKHSAVSAASVEPMSELVTELVVCEGFLDIASVCASARVSTRWKALAYRPSSFGSDLDFSPFGHRLSARVFDRLIRSRRIRLAHKNKRLRSVNLWNCCGVSFRKSAELLSLCSELKELRIVHNKQRSCPNCVHEPHTTFFRDFSYLMNRCDNLWVRSSTEIFWLGRAETFIGATARDVQRWFADHLSVECAADNPCLQRITALVNEFGRTVAQGRPMQNGLLFMLTSLRNHTFTDHGELEVLASDEQWIHEDRQIELAYMKFAVRGCTPPSPEVAASQAAHGAHHHHHYHHQQQQHGQQHQSSQSSHQASEQSLQQSQHYQHLPQQVQQQLSQAQAQQDAQYASAQQAVVHSNHTPAPNVPNGSVSGHHPNSVSQHGHYTAQAQSQSHGQNTRSHHSGQLSANALALAQAHLASAHSHAHAHNSANTHSVQAHASHAGTSPGQSTRSASQTHPHTSANGPHDPAVHSQDMSSHSAVTEHVINLTEGIPGAPHIELHLGVQPASTSAHAQQAQSPTATAAGTGIAHIVPHPGNENINVNAHAHGNVLQAQTHTQQQQQPRVCMAPNHVLFLGAPYRWPQPRALPRRSDVDSFSSTTRT